MRDPDARDLRRAHARVRRCWSGATATCRTWSSRSRRASSGCCRRGRASAPSRQRSRSRPISSREGLIDEEEAISRIEAARLDQLLHPTIDPDAERRVLAMGLPASPGAASGEIVFDANEAEALKAQGKDVILVRTETSPEDIHGMHAAVGILTARGGMTSHAAVVARGMGRPCVCGAGSLRIDAKAGTHDGGRQGARQARRHHHRRHQGRGAGGPRADAPAGAVGRLRHHHGLGRQGAPPGRARQRRHPARGGPGAPSSAPRASGCAAPSTCSSRRAASSPCAR